MLLHIPQILTSAERQQVRDLIDAGHWQDGRKTAGPQAAQAKNNQQLATGEPATQAAQAIVLSALARHPLFLSAALPRRIFPPQFNRYGGASNHYGNHVDGAVMTVQATGERVRSDVSCTLFLCEPGSYEGGDLVIEDTYGSQRIKLPAGDMVIYPSTSVHRVEPVTQGHRIASFFWVESMVRSDEQRRLLYDFDMALMSLRAELGEAPSCVKMAGTYHNLLRMWAQT
jgi:PKHD-type hydroxylase